MYIGKSLETFRRTQPDKVALYYDDTKMTYATFVTQVMRFRQTLRSSVQKEKQPRVALLITNEPALLEMFFAIVTLGWVAIPIDPKWTVREAEQAIALANPDLIVASKKFTSRIRRRFPISFYVEDGALEEVKNGSHERCGELRGSTIKQVECNVTDISSNTPFYLGFTSGSTGVPKGYIRSHGSWLKSFQACEEAFHYHSDDVLMAPGPLCHSLSLFAAIHALHIGASFAFQASFNHRTVIEMMRASNVSAMYAVPTMLLALAEKNSATELKSTFISAGATLEPSVYRKLKKSFPNSNIYEFYGASELSIVTYATEDMLTMYPESVGKPFPDVHISIRNEAGQVLKRGEIGQIFMESPYIFDSYIADQKATDDVLTSNGATAGDIGYINEAGLLCIVGRKNNMIIRGGQNVYPEEVEALLKEFPFVEDAVVVGNDDAYWGEQIIALVQWSVAVRDERHYVSQLRRHCRKYLATYKRPHTYVTVAKFPYTTSGKIDREKARTLIGSENYEYTSNR